MATRPVDPAMLAPYIARELAPGIHLLAEPPIFPSNAAGNVPLIEQADGVVLVDSGESIGYGRRVVAYVRSLTDKPVKAVLLTHWHGDHTLGIEAIRAAWPHVRIIATPQTRAGMLGPLLGRAGLRPDDRYDTQAFNLMSIGVAQSQGSLRDPSTDAEDRQIVQAFIRNRWTYARGFAGTYMVPPTETFADQLLLDDPERPVRLLDLGPANTQGDAVAWLPRQRVLITGDIVVAPIGFGFNAYPKGWISVLERLKALDFSMLVPGHGEPMTDEVYLDHLIGSIRDIRAQVGPLALQGLTLEQVRQRVDFSAQSAIFGTTPRLAGLFQSLWLAPMVENAWKEARGVPILQVGALPPPPNRPTTSGRGRRSRR
jgi:glyoxylase-like metal-dependent hydrolase (beta-lactamase superfamily II)